MRMIQRSNPRENHDDRILHRHHEWLCSEQATPEDLLTKEKAKMHKSPTNVGQYKKEREHQYLISLSTKQIGARHVPGGFDDRERGEQHADHELQRFGRLMHQSRVALRLRVGGERRVQQERAVRGQHSRWQEGTVGGQLLSDGNASHYQRESVGKSDEKALGTALTVRSRKPRHKEAGKNVRD